MQEKANCSSCQTYGRRIPCQYVWHELQLAFSCNQPIVVHAKRMDEEFRVNTLEGNYKQGKPGDYLMCGIDGELYICDGPIFEKTYDWV